MKQAEQGSLDFIHTATFAKHTARSPFVPRWGYYAPMLLIPILNLLLNWLHGALSSSVLGSSLLMSWCIICVSTQPSYFPAARPVVFRHSLRIWSERSRGPGEDIKHPECPSGSSPLLSFSTFHSPLMRTPPNYFSGWSVGTQPELDPLRSDVTAMLMKAGDQ